MKIEKIVRCKGTWDEITALANVIDKLGLEWYKHSATDETNTKYWVLEILCDDLRVRW